MRSACTTWRFTRKAAPMSRPPSAKLQAMGAEITDPPAEYDYLPGYYAVYFLDPDGIKLEVAHTPGFPA